MMVRNQEHIPRSGALRGGEIWPEPDSTRWCMLSGMTTRVPMGMEGS